MRKEGEISFEIIEYLGTLSEQENGWQKEVNIVSWNGGDPKLDIRSWSSNHCKMSRGITLSMDELKNLQEVIKYYK
jgi:hypothetical protein